METNILTDILLPLALAFIMLGMGLSLKIDDFKRIFIYPKAIGIGLVNQIILLPVVGFLLITWFQLSGALAVGIMILAACPGGATSNLIAHLSKGDTALSISLTAFSSLITIVSIPLIVNFSLEYFNQTAETLKLPVFKTIIQVFGVTIFPVFIGILIRNKYLQFAINSEKAVKVISAIFLTLIIVAAILKQKHQVVEFFISAGPVALALNLGSMLLGFVSAKIFKLNASQSITIAIESGIQNGTLGIMLASTLLKNAEMSIPPAIYSLIMFGTAFFIISFSGKLVKSKIN